MTSNTTNGFEVIGVGSVYLKKNTTNKHLWATIYHIYLLRRATCAENL